MNHPRNLAELDLNDLIPPLPFPNADHGTQQSFLGTPPQSLSAHGGHMAYTGMTHHPGMTHCDSGLTHHDSGCSQDDPDFTQIDAAGTPNSGFTQNVTMAHQAGGPQNSAMSAQARGYLPGHNPVSQAQPVSQGATKVYYENPTTESQLAAAGGTLYKMNVSTGTAPVPGVLRVIHLDYIVYNRSVTNQIASVHPSGSKGGKSGAAAAGAEWDCITPKHENIWKTALESWAWPNAQAVIITLLGESRKHLGKHLTALNAEGLLKWQCIINNHGTYGVGAKYYVYSDEDFHPFVQTVLTKPKSRVTIKIIMDDPRKNAKEKLIEQSENDSLAMSYAEDDDRLALHRVQARLVLNPKADINSGLRTKYVAEITQHILMTYGGDTESLRIQDPDDATRSIRVNRECLYIWARALVAEAKGVTTEVPPKTKEFVSEAVTVYTLAEQKTTDKRRASRGKTTDGTSPAVKFTAPRRTASGRIRAPRIDLSGEPDPDELESPEELLLASTPATSKASRRLSEMAQMTTPVEQQRLGRPRDVAESSPNVLVDIISDAETPQDDLASSSSPEPEVHRSPFGSGDGTDIVCVSGGKGPDISRSPARKIPRSPAGDRGIAHTISRLDYNRHRSPLSGRAPSPTRKVPSTQRSASVISSTERVALPPLNEAGRSLSMEGFLDLCNFEKDDPVPRFLIKLTHICHWDFFYRNTNVVQLQSMGFPYPIASQLMNGARSLEATHTQLQPAPSEVGTQDSNVDRNPFPPSPEY